MSTLDPAGPAAARIASIWWVMFWGALAILGFVGALLTVAFRQGQARRQQSPRRWIIGLGLIFTSTIVAALLVFGLVVGEGLLPRDDARLVRVTAHATRWQWTFGYPGDMAETAGTLHIPAGRPVNVVITSGDVIHSFWVPRLAGKMDAIPGRANVLRLSADRPGTYAGVCAEYCGTGHARHGLIVIAHDAAGWARFHHDAGRPR